MPDVWPIGIGAPCVGCTEKKVAFKVPIFDKANIPSAVPPATYPPIDGRKGEIDPLATGVVGLAAAHSSPADLRGLAAVLAKPRDPGLPGGKEGDESVPLGGAARTGARGAETPERGVS